MNKSLPAPGFRHPVMESQSCFRIILNAMSEPGTQAVIRLNKVAGALHASSYGVLLTLCDMDTAVWLSPALRSSQVVQSLAFHCGCKFTKVPEEADFAVITLTDDLQVLERFSPGTDRDPDQSCTTIIQADGLFEPQHSLKKRVWTGPGISTTRNPDLNLPGAFWRLRQQINDFPRGVDFIFCSGDQLMALPRTTIVVAEEEPPCT